MKNEEHYKDRKIVIEGPFEDVRKIVEALKEGCDQCDFKSSLVLYLDDNTKVVYKQEATYNKEKDYLKIVVESKVNPQ